MPTIETEVSELVMRLRQVFETEAGRNKSEFARRLRVNRTTAINWIDGSNSPDLKNRDVAKKIAAVLQVSPIEVLALDGYEVSDEVPDLDILGDQSGA